MMANGKLDVYFNVQLVADNKQKMVTGFESHK